MAIYSEEDYGVPAHEDLAPGRMQSYVNIAGALTSLALVIGLGVWGYKLAVRDVSGIPVVRAMAGPMRIAPQEPGGEIAAHVGLSVNEIAAEGGAAPLPERMVLAPKPLDLAAEDASGEMLAAKGSAAPADAATPVLASLPRAPSTDGSVAPLVPLVPVEQVTETPAIDEGALPDVETTAAPVNDTPTETDSAVALEDAVNGALAEALGTVDTASVADTSGVSASIRPQRRPEGDGSAEAASNQHEAAQVTAVIDVASITPGSRLVQLGAFDDEAGAKAEWVKLQELFGDLIAPKSMVLQTATAGGRTFVRLRAYGFDDDADARRFCAALLAENATCIPVVQR
ncbi:SPOR domain-containing protein [Tabrizicola sp. J26]|uniref:SPOR domain-containing protein n=1 Tax=Alitabrizicola rongguiensis TaxID=2909234 RepID=UPI001F1752E8|nr:SPOR domain-containing protein [Tabrizicola rongguiensis]MCF1710061.1 SPOR domain-containing protein [Tabrizicola rongguiensis]